MARRPYMNPVRRGEDQELFRAMGSLVDQMNRKADEQGQVYVSPWYSASAAGRLYLISPVPRQGFKLGRVSFTFTADTTFNASHYYTFTLYQHYTVDGVRTPRPVENGSWGTNVVAPRAHMPYTLEMDLALDPGDTLSLVIATTGVPADAEFSIQTEESFGPEE